MKDVIKQTIALWTKNSWQLIGFTLLSITLPLALKNLLSFDYIRLDFILKTVLIGGVFCYLNTFQTQGKKELTSYFKVINLLLTFILLAVTLILYQKFFNRIAYNYISTDLHFSFVDSKGWLITNLVTVNSLLELPIIALTILVFLPMTLAPAVVAFDQTKIIQALSKSSLIVFSHFGFVLSGFIAFQSVYFLVNPITNDFIKIPLQAVFLSLEICFYYILFYSTEMKERNEREQQILNNFGK